MHFQELVEIESTLSSRLQKWSCNNAQIVLDKLSEALIHDPQASGGVVVDNEDNLSVLYYRSGFSLNILKCGHLSKFPLNLLLY